MQFYRETEFQRTSIGKLPKKWDVVKFQNVAEFKNGINFSKKQKGKKGILTIDVLNMYGDSLYVIFDHLYRLDINFKENSDYVLKKGDILFVRSSLKREGAGWASLFNGYKEPVTFCGFIIRARLKEQRISQEFLTYFLRSNMAREKILSRAGQVAITNVTQDNLSILYIPIPSLPEQQQIASVLLKIDDAIQKTDGIIQKIQLLKKGLMQELLTKGIGHKDFKYSKELGCKIPMEWAISDLGARCRVIMGQSPPSRTYNEDGDGIPFFQGNVDFGERNPMVRIYCSEPKKIAKKDDILFSVRAPVGELNIANRECCIGRGLAAIRVEGENDRDYVLYSIKQFLKNLVPQGSTFQAVGKTEMETFCLSFPRSEEQRQIASILSNVDDQIEKERQTKEQLERLKKGLMQILLTGKVRIKVN